MSESEHKQCDKQVIQKDISALPIILGHFRPDYPIHLLFHTVATISLDSVSTDLFLEWGCVKRQLKDWLTSFRDYWSHSTFP